MTHKAAQQAIAEFCGWKVLPKNPWWIRWLWGQHLTQSPDGRKLCGYLPKYTCRIEEMHEAEKQLSPVQVSLMDNYLQEICERDYRKIKGYTPTYCYLWQATAVQHVEAFLKTIGKWENE
jgi:hypothetical protein